MSPCVVLSVAVCRFANTGDEWHVLVGVAKDLILNPRSVAGGFVYTYKLVNSGEKLEFLHKVRARWDWGQGGGGGTLLSICRKFR